MYVRTETFAFEEIYILCKVSWGCRGYSHFRTASGANLRMSWQNFRWSLTFASADLIFLTWLFVFLFRNRRLHFVCTSSFAILLSSITCEDSMPLPCKQTHTSGICLQGFELPIPEMKSEPPLFIIRNTDLPYFLYLADIQVISNLWNWPTTCTQ